MASLKSLLAQVRGCTLCEPHLPMTEIVKSWRKYWPRVLPLPHPSPRYNLWLRKNSWFEKQVIPALCRRVAELTL